MSSNQNALKKWLGNSKIINDDGSAMLVYHGTLAEFERFDALKSQNGLIFFALEKGFATDYVSDGAKGKPVRLISAHLCAENPWDYMNEDHVASLLEAMSEKGIKPSDQIMFDEGIDDGDWMTIEAEGILGIIKALGHDGLFVTEGSDMDRNIAVFNAEQIMIVDPRCSLTYDGQDDKLDEDIDPYDNFGP